MINGVTQIEKLFFRSWWVAAFAIFCFTLYEQGVKIRNEDYNNLNKHLSALQEQRYVLEEEKEDLLLQINSQSDPAWIELTLMKVLGLVPEGYSKIHIHIMTHEEQR